MTSQSYRIVELKVQVQVGSQEELEYAIKKIGRIRQVFNANLEGARYQA